MPDSGDLESYYARRAREYERIYELPERQADLARLREVLVAFGGGRRLLEVACGTGYWTEVVAPAAASVLATDSVEEVLALARQKGLASSRVSFACADAFDLEAVQGDFDGAFAAFWWSHVRRGNLAEFLGKLHRRLGAGAGVLFFDNRFVVDSSTPVARADETGDTYQERVLADGTRFEVLKNFPSAEEVRTQIVGSSGEAVEVHELEYFWHATYRVGDAA